MKLIKNIVLAIVAIILFIVVFVIGIITEFVIAIFNWSLNGVKDFFNACYFGVNYLIYQIALSIDKSGGVVGKRLWNWLFITEKATVRFGTMIDGKPYSISYILGLSYNECTMTRFGLWFKEFLDLFEYDHIIKAVE